MNTFSGGLPYSKNQTSKFTPKDFQGIGKGISGAPLLNYDRRQTVDQNLASYKDYFKHREAKSIPKEILPIDSGADSLKHTPNEATDTNFSDLVKMTDSRRTYSTSPYGGQPTGGLAPSTQKSNGHEGKPPQKL